MTLAYLLRTLLASGLLFLYYRMALRNRSGQGFNRAVLIAIPALALAVPLLRLPWPSGLGFAEGPRPIRLLQVIEGSLSERESPGISGGFFRDLSPGFVLAAAAACVSAFFLIRLGRRLYALQALTNSPVNFYWKGAPVHVTEHPAAPFSYGRHIFIPATTDRNDPAGRKILAHEWYHTRSGHTADILWLECAAALFWFNPVFWLVRDELRMVHEFAADEFAARGEGRLVYAELLVHEGRRRSAPAHSFFHHPLKRRIFMLTHKFNNKTNAAAQWLALPVFLLLVAGFGFASRPLPARPQTRAHYKVIVDPGHGGSESGAGSKDGKLEKDLTLAISKRIVALAPEYEIDVVLTRKDDALTVKNGSLSEDLQYRADLAAKENASAFISIHVNADITSPSDSAGMLAYIAKSNAAIRDRSAILGSALLGRLGKDFSVSPVLRTQEKGVRVLEHNTVPAVLIECGWMTNPAEVAMLSQAASQDKIARDILAGIADFARNGSNAVSATAIPGMVAK